MGLGPVNAIRTARFLKYLDNRGLKDTKDQKSVCFPLVTERWTKSKQKVI